MKRYLSFFMFLFFIIFTSSYSLTASSAEEQYTKGGHHHKATRESSENFEFSGKLEDGIRVIEVTASRYKFSPDPIVVKLGEKVRIVATSLDVTHGLKLPAYKLNLVIPSGKEVTVEFTADKEGTFHFHCSVYCGSGHHDMHGTLKVIKD